MNKTLQSAFEAEMAAARRLVGEGRLDAAFVRLETAHVLGQRRVVSHVQSHWWMLKIGLKRRSLAEVWGQAVRIVLGALGSAVGIVPTGNTGGTNLNMFRRLPIPQEIRVLLDRR